MPALLAMILTASQIALASDSVPKFDVERTCEPVAAASGLPGRDAPACQRDEQDARNTLQQDWTQYSSIQRSRCTGLVATGGPPSYVELLTCLEMAKHANQVEKSPNRNCWPPLVVSPGLRRAPYPLSQSLLGVKRTRAVAPHMSAFDPKRTLGASRLACYGRYIGWISQHSARL